MITKIRIQNYRSFVDAEVTLRPFSLVVGANGSGKSNLLKFFVTAGEWAGRERNLISELQELPDWPTHQMHKGFRGFEIGFADGTIVAYQPKTILGSALSGQLSWGIGLPVYNVDASCVSRVELAVPNPAVKGDGSGTTQVLDSLKNGDREDLFDQIERNFRRYVPEVEKLSLRTVEQGKKLIQVRERGLKSPVPATELSEGTRLILAILTIIHQENPPPVVLLEDIDRGLHPRLFEYIVPLMRDIAERQKVNILATTHNPYLVDCFQDDKEAVIIAEKKDGASTLSTLASRLEGLDYDKVDPDDLPLGNLWFTGLVGGTPAKVTLRP